MIDVQSYTRVFRDFAITLALTVSTIPVYAQRAPRAPEGIVVMPCYAVQLPQEKIVYCSGKNGLSRVVVDRTEGRQATRTVFIFEDSSGKTSDLDYKQGKMAVREKHVKRFTTIANDFEREYASFRLQNALKPIK
jgi:hypothetical protein